VSEVEASQKIRQRYGVPAGLGLSVDAERVLAWAVGAEAIVRQVAVDPAAVPVADVRGRMPLGRVTSEGGPLLVRTYRKGGLLRHLRGRRFRGRWRPLDELVLHRDLRAAAVPVPEAVGCIVLRSPRGWNGFLLVREVAGALDLEAFLYGVRPTGLAADLAPEDVLRHAGAAVRSLHEAGVDHADLHPKNLLVTPAGGVLVLDLDRARRHAGPLPEDARLANLVRLGRSIEKHRLKGLRTGRREALRFLEGYAGTRAEAALLLERVRVRLAHGLALRRTWWRLSGAARPWRAVSEGDVSEGAAR